MQGKDAVLHYLDLLQQPTYWHDGVTSKKQLAWKVGLAKSSYRYECNKELFVTKDMLKSPARS